MPTADFRCATEMGLQMRVLVFGGDGQLGREFRRLDGHAGHSVVALAQQQTDITRADEVASAVRESLADAVVNAAAYTAVDRAESECEQAYLVNRDGARNIARSCAARSLPMVQISTDYVFDGRKSGAYVDDDPTAPLSVYGTSKEAGERVVRDSQDRHVIIRTSWVFSAHGHNFVKTMLRLAAERDEIAVVSDQVGCPTPAADLAAATLDILSSLRDGRWGTYHFCGAGPTSWYGFAKEIFELRSEITGLSSPRLRAITTADYPSPAPRPANSELDCSRFAAAFGVSQRPWSQGLAQVLDELLKREGVL